MAGLGLTAFRFSIEWARIEPAEGEFSRAALDHYRRVLAWCQEHAIVPIVTFHHFTLPRWLQVAGGFCSTGFPACSSAIAPAPQLRSACFGIGPVLGSLPQYL
jgi:beta-glucosidase